MIENQTLDYLFNNLSTISTWFFSHAEPFLYVVMGSFVAIYIGDQILGVIAKSYGGRANARLASENETRMNEENYRAYNQIENDKALSFEEKYGEKQVSREKLEKELLN